MPRLCARPALLIDDVSCLSRCDTRRFISRRALLIDVGHHLESLSLLLGQYVPSLTYHFGQYVTQQGVSGITGDPHPNLEEGVRKEHCDMADSKEIFTTSNYGISTDPETEYNLAMGGGEGLRTTMVELQDGTKMVFLRSCAMTHSYTRHDSFFP